VRGGTWVLEEMGRGKAWVGMRERHLSWPGLALGLAGRHVGLSEWVCRSVNGTMLWSLAQYRSEAEREATRSPMTGPWRM